MPLKESFAFISENRLHYPWEYRLFFKKSQAFKFSECVIYRIPNEYGHYRVGITIKARGSSVERNHVKRQIREFFRLFGAKLGPFDYNVVIPASRKMAFPYPKKLATCLRGPFLDVITHH